MMSMIDCCVKTSIRIRLRVRHDASRDPTHSRRSDRTWRAVYEPAVFTSDEEMVSKIDISPSSVNERSSGLRAGPCKVLRIKDESTRASHDEGRPSLHGHPENIGRRDFMRIRIHAESAIGLRT